MAQLAGPDEIESLRIELAEIGRSLRLSFRSFTSSFRSITDVNYAPDDGEEDEEEGGENEMQWVALQRLPTFERINKALFDEKEGDATGKRVVNITKLGPQERHMFIDKLVVDVKIYLYGRGI
ncbi:hypothetical protein Pint_24201 [Pistacia integerrima]|uniref:Uncharacterized protein n=1 Tax=Pistacia integerrima TaxID=434235 RepID=A0ACC0YI67_9ROSI|nr:hypothetical protein Pint_24201 [Pistacia integerrima]